MPLGEADGHRPGAQVSASGQPLRVDVRDALLGRALDGLGSPMDGKGPIDHGNWYPAEPSPPDPLCARASTSACPSACARWTLMVPCGRGQRLGIFAGSGVGKSSLLGMIARSTSDEINVICLVGERGREVLEFMQRDLGAEGLARSVVVCATSDQPALVRLKAAFTATAIAEYFRDQGTNVLLMMDSVTRFAMAQREVGLAIGEPPATRGYTPSVFALLPKLLERSGTSPSGSITAPLHRARRRRRHERADRRRRARHPRRPHRALAPPRPRRPLPGRRRAGQSVSRLVAEIIHARRAVRPAARSASCMATYHEKADLIAIGAYAARLRPADRRGHRGLRPDRRLPQAAVHGALLLDSADATRWASSPSSAARGRPVVDGYVVDPTAAMAAGNGADGGMPLRNAIPPLHIPT